MTRAYLQLRSLIVRGYLPQGARIAEGVLAERMGLSRTPIRSALHRLQQEGFVASVGRSDQRLIVTPLTQTDGRELFLIVGHLEGLAAREAASLPPDTRRTLVKRLREINRTLSIETNGRSSASQLFDLDYQFHQTYVDGIVGPRLMTLHRAIKPQVERYNRLYVDILLDQLPTSVTEHEAIATAIAEGDLDSAEKAVERNWHNAAARLARVFADQTERGIWHEWDRDTSVQRRSTKPARGASR